MKCSDARFALAANPGDRDPAVASHLEACPECAAYAAEMVELDRRLSKALQVDVPARVRSGPLPGPEAAPVGAAVEGARTSTPVPAARPRTFRSPMLALAASAAGVAVLVAMLWSAFPRETLAAALVDHMSHEPQAWGTTTPMPASAIAYALARTGVRLENGLGDVTYANTCWFRGRGVPHLVVRSAAGPVTVMVLPHENVPRRLPFDEGGYRGVLVPAARGSIAVLSRDTTDLDAATLESVAARTVEAIRYVD